MRCVTKKDVTAGCFIFAAIASDIPKICCYEYLQAFFTAIFQRNHLRLSFYYDKSTPR